MLFTKCIQVLLLALFRAFGDFPSGILRTSCPIRSIASAYLFPRVDLGVGQKTLSKKTVLTKSVTPCVD